MFGTDVLHDVRHALRALLKEPGYAATAMLTLALGIGFSTATFSVVNAVLLRPLPYADPGELLVLRERRLPNFPEFSVSPGHYLTWRERATLFEGVAAWATGFRNFDAGDGQPERVRAVRVSANLFPLLGIDPALGRGFTEADDAGGAAPVVVVSHGSWQRRFGGGDIVGRTVRISGEPVTVVGVMPAGFGFPQAETELWVPLAMDADERRRYGNHYLGAIARMKPGVTLARAQADLDAVMRQLARDMPDSSNTGWEALAFPLHAYLTRSVRTTLLVLFGAVSLVLLIACVNVANLLLVRGAARQKELAIRSSIGAGRLRIVRQLLVEQLTLSVCSAAGGVLLAGWLLRSLLGLLPDALPRQAEIRLDGGVLGFAVGLAVLTPLVFGLVPAVQASRPDLRTLLAAGGRGGAHASRGLRRALIVAELALAVVLLVAAGLLVRSFANLAAASPGFAPEGTAVAEISLPGARYPAGEARERFFGELLEGLRSLPQVAAAGLTQSVPMLNDFVASMEVEGQPVDEGARPTANFYAVSPGYFETMRIPLRRGRAFTDADRRGSARVAIVNERLVERHFPGGDPIGRRIRVSQGPDESWREIVGVVGDVKHYNLTDRPPAQVYEPYPQHPYFGTYSIVVRSVGDDPTAVVPDMRRLVRRLDGDVPLSRVARLDRVVSGSIWPQRFSAALIVLFGAAAVLLAAVGIYSVIAYSVGLRGREFAIRVAHGASRTDILRLVLTGAGALAVSGVAGGLAASWLLRRTLENLLFGVTPEDVPTYGLVGTLLIVVALAASAVPALRATRTDPAAILRGD